MNKRTKMLSSKRICIAVLAMAACTVPVAAQSDGLAMLTGLTKGEWTITPRSGAPVSKICVRTGRELIQIRHTQADCNRFVVEDSPSQVSVQYTCPGNGYGRTNIRRETENLVQVESQGIADGLPFQVTAEVRRTGSC